MARKETVFQALDRAVRGDWGRNTVASPHVNTYNVSGNDVIYRTTDKDDYEQKKLELQQNEFLKNRWVKANVNLSVTAYAGLNNIKLMYRDADLMDAFPEIGAALDLVSEESVTPFPDNGQVVHISSKSERVKNILEDLFVNRLNLQLTAPMIIRAMCKYGNQFMLLNIDRKNGVLGWKQMPVFNVERIESGIQNPFGAGASLAVNGVNVDKADLSTQFVWLDDNNSQIPFREWQIAHFRLLTNSLYLPYGCLVGDTRIELEEGYKEIKDIKVGDKVWTFNIDTQERELSQVTVWMDKGIQDALEIETAHNQVSATKDHRFLVYEDETFKYKEAQELAVGDLLVIDNSSNKGDKTEKIKRITPVGKQHVYDITIDNNNSNFFANGIVTHNCSYLNSARRHWRILSLLEDMMLIYRLERSVERRVYKIYVGAIDDADVPAYMESIANEFKRTPIIDPMTGQVDLRKNLLGISDDIFVPTRNENSATPIDTLPAGQNLTAIDDIKFIQNKVLTALRIPKTFLNFEENVGDGKNLALMDIRFTRVINRIQQAFLMELTRVASIHLFLLGFDDDLTNFTLSMNNPSTQAEQLEIENMQKKIDAIRDAVSDPGNGLPVMSQMRALREILKWSDKQIKENLEEIRLEKGVAAELEKTTQIIKKTGIFDNVDRIYGEPGAEYIDDQQGGQGGMDNGGGMGGGPSGGGMTPPPMDNGSGSELDNMDSSMNADDNGTINGEEGSVPTQDMPTDNTPMESALKRKPLLTESSTLDKLFDKYLSTLNEHNSHLNETKVERVKAYDDDALLINEDFDKMINALGKFVNDETEEQN